MPKYNLLPDQIELARGLVRIYDNGKCSNTFDVSGDIGGNARIVWEECDISTLQYRPQSLYANLIRLVELGLINNLWGDTFQINPELIEAVNNNFEESAISNLVASKSSSIAPVLDFVFVVDPDLRQQIVNDYNEVKDCVSVSARKATIVLCGSIVEALLFERLARIEPQAKAAAAKLQLRHKNRNLDGWDLNELVDVATDLGIIDRVAESHADQLRDYRNVIHPGVHQRTNFVVTPAKVTSALALLHVIVEKLSPP